MLGFFLPKNDNAWLASDRRERLKLIATAFLSAAALASGFGLLIVGLVTN
ncbi:MAG TPA: hypothetical protein VK477_10930 [Acidobacteriota bacterium]|nr:hypothetical protein [Acidobacteriota bacterium]